MYPIILRAVHTKAVTIQCMICAGCNLCDVCAVRSVRTDSALRTDSAVRTGGGRLQITFLKDPGRRKILGIAHQEAACQEAH